MRHLAKHARKLLFNGGLAMSCITLVVCCFGPVLPQSDRGTSACANPSWTAGSDTASSIRRGRHKGGEARQRQDSAQVEDLRELRGRVIEDSTGHGLDSFYEMLSVVDHADDPGVRGRVTCFGDSHTAADFMTGQLRRRMQTRFGDGGHGFIAAGRPWRSYRHRDISGGASGHWETIRLRGASSENDDDKVGLAGVAIETDRRNGTVWLSTATDAPVGQRASSFEVYYLAQPQGGRLGVSLDQDLIARLSSRSPDPLPAYFRVDAEDGPHHLLLEAQGRGRVRLFGVSVEREGPGVIVDSLGINGARITAMLSWDEEIHVEHLAHLGPDMLVLWYGGNSVADDWYTLEQYEQWFVEVLTLVRRAVPDAACLLLGPADMARASLVDRGPRGTPAALQGIIDAQREAANLMGCGFFDVFEAMGGEGSNQRWAEQEPPLSGSDGIHYTIDGYEELGDLVFNALLEGYEQYLEDHSPEMISSL